MQNIDDLKKQLAGNNIQGLAVDIDETLSWTIGYWVAKMQEEFGNPEDLSVEELVAKYRYTQNVPYWQTEEAIAWMDKHRNSNEIQEMLPLITGADAAILEIDKVVPIVAYITTRPEVVVAGTEKWLVKHHFPSAPIIARPSEVHITEGNNWKAQVLTELYPQVLGIIDDNPGLAHSLASNYQGVVYLYDNTEHPRHDINIIPCASWDDVRSKIMSQHTRA